MTRWRAAIAAGLLTATPAVAAPSGPSPFAAPPLALGTAWYPEQWPEARWDDDLALMRGAHLGMVRIGEFAWARMEPADGRFDFGWLDRAIAAASRHGLKVVLGTPTAAPPIWLTENHPDVRRVNPDGSVEGHGGRRQFSFASATYRRYAVRIATEMAKRYGHDPDVVGWQIDNEIGVPSYDSEAKRQWTDWLRRRYGTIDTLNRRWTTQYWSQVYQRFDQVPLTLAPDQNPALLLDMRRFQSAVWADYVRDQARAIRAHADPRQFITTNSTRWNDNFDQYRVHGALDIAAWDEYVPDGHPDWDALALHHDVVRGYKRRDFWVMETQPGAVDWGPVNRALDPGATRELAWQAVAHGADAVLYWQWRSALNGQEQYHGTLVGPDGRPMPVYAEIARTAAELRQAAPLLAGTTPVASVAMIYSQDSRWAIEQQRFAKGYDPIKVMTDWYRPFARAGVTVDVLPPEAGLSRYRLVLAPDLNLLTADTAARLAAWVRAGGHLVLGPRSGMKDADDALWSRRQPGPLADLLGAHVEQHYALDAPVALDGVGAGASASIWAETLDPVAGDVRIVARYRGGGWLDGRPAIVSHAAGKGTITYVGALVDPATLRRLAAAWLHDAHVVPPVVAVPPDTEVVERAGAGRRILLVINHDSATITVRPRSLAGRLYGNGTGTTVAGHDVAIFSIREGESSTARFRQSTDRHIESRSSERDSGCKNGRTAKLLPSFGLTDDANRKAGHRSGEFERSSHAGVAVETHQVPSSHFFISSHNTVAYPHDRYRALASALVV